MTIAFGTLGAQPSTRKVLDLEPISPLIPKSGQQLVSFNMITESHVSVTKVSKQHLVK